MNIRIIKDGMKRSELAAMAGEEFGDAVYGGKLYKSSLRDLQKYFDQFAYAARLHA